jgi:hypothetical protein
MLDGMTEKAPGLPGLAQTRRDGCMENGASPFIDHERP